MIYVDVFVAGVGKWYEFKCNEKKTAGEIADRIYKVILKKEHIEEFPAGELMVKKKRAEHNFWLCCMEQERVLDSSMTMEECGVENGCRLLLV